VCRLWGIVPNLWYTGMAIEIGLVQFYIGKTKLGKNRRTVKE
jgi:hypothetical protein